MTLTENDYYSISEQITEGSGSVEYSKNGETLYFDYTLTTDGYTEDDYFNGTGAFIETDKTLNVQNVESYDNDGEETANDFKESNLYDLI